MEQLFEEIYQKANRLSEIETLHARLRRTGTAVARPEKDTADMVGKIEQLQLFVRPLKGGKAFEELHQILWADYYDMSEAAANIVEHFKITEPHYQNKIWDILRN